MSEQTGRIKTDMEAHDYVMSLPIRDVVRQLVEMLGATTVAVIGGVKETRAVQQWMADREPQRPHVLRFALQIAIMLTSVADRELAQAWFRGANPRLDDEIPALILRDRPLEDVQRTLLAAARSFGLRSAEGKDSVQHRDDGDMTG